MKILYLTPGCFDKGGISRYNRYQIRALREIFGARNVEVISLLGPGSDSFEEPFEVAFSAGGLTPAHKAGFLARAASFAATRRPGVIMSAHVNISGAAQVLAKLAGACTILNVYGSEVWSGFRRDSAWGLRSVTHIISDCHFTAKYLEDHGWRPPGTTSVVWDCVDLAQFSPGNPDARVLQKYGIPDPTTGINLLTLGRISVDAVHKGYERLLEVFARVSPHVPSLRLIYAGRGSLVERLRRDAESRGLADRVFFTGMIDDGDLADVYRSAHLFSLVSDRGVGRGEGIPLTPLEAAACGVPILVGNQDGSREAVVDDINGCVVDPFDLDAHAACVLKLAVDAAVRSRKGQAARRHIEEEFAYTGFRAKHEALFESWFSRGGAG